MSLSGTEETVALVSWLVSLAPVLVQVMAPFIPATTGTTGVVPRRDVWPCLIIIFLSPRNGWEWRTFDHLQHMAGT